MMRKSMFKKYLAFLLILAMVISGFSTVHSASALAADDTSETISTNGNAGKTDVGAWYTTYNVYEYWQARFGSGKAVGYQALLADGSYGIPFSGSITEIDFQIEKMVEAGIDFIVFDLTNGGLSAEFDYGTGANLQFILAYVKLVCERLAVWNASHNWKVHYAIGIGTYAKIRAAHISGTNENGTNQHDTASLGLAIEKQAQAVQEQFLNQTEYAESYYRIDGKPLLVLHNLSEGNALTCSGGYDSYTGDKTYSSAFSLKPSSSFAEKNSWSWLTGDSDGDANCGTVEGDEVMVVCPGQWNHGSDSIPNAWRKEGRHYEANWNAVLNAQTTPRFVLISSLNDYMEDTAIWPADTSGCTVEEKWYNYEDGWTAETNDGRAVDADMYWNMTTDYIKQLREKNRDTFLPEKADEVTNLLFGMTPTTPASRTAGGLTNLTDGKHGYSDSQAYVLYGAFNTQDNETWYQFDFDTLTELNQVKLYLSNQETDRFALDIAVDVKLENGEWRRVAARYDIAYNGSNPERINRTEDGKVTSRLEFNFAPVKCMAIRATANRQRIRETVKDTDGNLKYANSTLNWRLTEIEAYNDPTITEYTGIDDLDDEKYHIGLIGSERIVSQNQEVTVTGARTSTGVEKITNGSNDTVNAVILQFTQTKKAEEDLIRIDIKFQEAEPINKVNIYRWFEYDKDLTPFPLFRNAKDIAIDVLRSNGSYVRVTETHTMEEQNTTASHHGNEYFYYFPTVTAVGIRVTFNKSQDYRYTYNQAHNTAYGEPLSPSEISASYDATVTEDMYTGVETPVVAEGKIPEYGSDNYALEGYVTSSNTNASLDMAYPLSNLKDGASAWNSSCSIINYRNDGLAWYQVNFDMPHQLNKVSLYLSMYQPEMLPTDIGVYVFSDGSWKRVADRHNIDYGLYENAAGATCLPSANNTLTFTFAAVECSAVRIVANRARNTKASNFRMVELACYQDPLVTSYAGNEHPDDKAYATTVNGDANLDFVANTADLTAVRQYLLGKGNAPFDVNYDDSIDVRDLICVKKAL